ncbi:MAG TPA: GWxTD domain-containing protein [Thermoanaerobaculia bacterium]|nr:GWxTD domain-containing protein [Thermoanaerobaculia bacterium]
MKTRILVCALFSVYSAAAAFGALSKEHNDFAKGPTQYLLTRDEQKQWKAVATDEQAKAFIDLFWARRDPSPGTPANEFRDSILKRMSVADSLYSTAKLRGAATDRGKVYVVMGPQTGIKRGGPQGGAGVHAQGSSFGVETGLSSQSVQGVAPSETWQYEQSKSSLPLGQPMVQVAFNDQYASNDWKMERIVGTDYATVFDRVARAYIAQPELNEVPAYAAASYTPMPATTAATGVKGSAITGTSGLKSEALISAIDAARASKAASDTLFVSYGEFITPAGESYVPVQLYVPKSAGLAAGTAVTFFGAVENADGSQRVVAFEEPATLTASHDDVFHARSLALPPGTYVGTFGLARDGKVISAVSTPMTVQTLDQSATALSGLMLSNNVHALTGTRATDPFTFGGIRVVPKGDRTFRPTDDLWYFMEARNPGFDAGTNQPKMSLKLSVTGKTDDGVEVERNAPAALVTVQPVRDMAGHYVIGEPLPLATFKPGSYTITVRVKDMALDRAYDLKESFRIVN